MSFNKLPTPISDKEKEERDKQRAATLAAQELAFWGLTPRLPTPISDEEYMANLRAQANKPKTFTELTSMTAPQPAVNIPMPKGYTPPPPTEYNEFLKGLMNKLNPSQELVKMPVTPYPFPPVSAAAKETIGNAVDKFKQQEALKTATTSPAPFTPLSDNTRGQIRNTRVGADLSKYANHRPHYAPDSGLYSKLPEPQGVLSQADFNKTLGANAPLYKPAQPTQPTIQAMTPELKEQFDRDEAEWKALPFANMPEIDIALEVGEMTDKKLSAYSPAIQEKLINIYNTQREMARNARTKDWKNIHLATLQPLTNAISSAPAKLIGGLVSGVEDTRDFIEGGGAYGLGYITGSDKLKNYGEAVLNRQNLGDKISTFGDTQANKSGLAKDIGNAVGAAGRIVPAIAAEVVSGGVSPALDTEIAKIGTTLLRNLPTNFIFGAGAGGSAAKEGYAKSGNAGKAYTYGAMVGLAEVATERLSGGIAGTSIGKVIDTAVDAVPVIGKLFDLGGEAFEESIMAFAEPIFQRVTGVDPKADFATTEDLLEAAKGGILLSLIMNGATYSVRRLATDNHQHKQQQKELIEYLNVCSEVANEMRPDGKAIAPLDENAVTADIIKKQGELQSATKEIEAALIESYENTKSDMPAETPAKKRVMDQIVDPKSEFEELQQTAQQMKEEEDAAKNVVIPESVENKSENFKKPIENISNSDIIDYSDINKSKLDEISARAQGLGQQGVAYTTDNEPIKYLYALMPVGNLTASHEMDGTPNAAYPQELQPRERDRAASIQQIMNIAKHLNPVLLGENNTVSDGAPIVDSNGIVESGNGRVIALSGAFKYIKENADAYHNYLRQNAEKFGISPADVKDDSVLVRVRLSDVDRAEFTRKANESGVAAYSATETAAADANRLTPEILALFAAESDGDLLSESNRDFVKKFVTAIIPASEQGRYITADGDLTQEGLIRIRNAVFQKAYEDTALLTKMSESLDDETKNLTRALLNIAPRVVSLKADIENGTAHQTGVVKNITDAVTLYNELRANGMTPDQYADQMTFGDKAPDEVIKIARAFDEYKRSAKKLSEYMGNLLEGVEALGNPNQISMFEGDENAEEEKSPLPKEGDETAEKNKSSASAEWNNPLQQTSKLNTLNKIQSTQSNDLTKTFDNTSIPQPEPAVKGESEKISDTSESKTGIRQKLIHVIENKKAVEIQQHTPVEKAKGEELFAQIGKVQASDETIISLSQKIVGKLLGHRGYPTKNIFNHIPKLLETAELIAHIPSKGAYTDRAGNLHRDKPNIGSYKHYVNKFTDGTANEYLIRFTAQVEKKSLHNLKKVQQQMFHSSAISNIAVYNLGQKQKTATGLPSKLLTQGDLSSAYVDPIIADILSDVKGFEENNENFLEGEAEAIPETKQKTIIGKIMADQPPLDANLAPQNTSETETAVSTNISNPIVPQSEPVVKGEAEKKLVSTGWTDTNPPGDPPLSTIDTGIGSSRDATSETQLTINPIVPQPEPAVKSEVEKISDTGESGANTKSQQIADWVKRKLENGEKFMADGRFGLFAAANRAYNGTMANNDYTSKDAYDAMELGVNQYILGMEDMTLEKIETVLSLLPTQTKRADGMDSFQQFSTPPTLAYLANYAANIQSGDVMLEPSAGIGGLAVYAKKAGAVVHVNELDERRLKILKNMPFDSFHNEDAEQINNILGGKIEPTVVVMNPPFSSSGTRNVHDTKIGARHIEQALSMLAPGGRLVAIVGRGMADDAPTFKKWWSDIKGKYNVVANIGIDGKNYTKYGTNFDVRMLVIDNTGSQSSITVTESYEDLRQVNTVLEDIRNGRSLETKRSGNEQTPDTAARKTADRKGDGGTTADGGLAVRQRIPDEQSDAIRERNIVSGDGGGSDTDGSIQGNKDDPGLAQRGGDVGELLGDVHQHTGEERNSGENTDRRSDGTVEQDGLGGEVGGGISGGIQRDVRGVRAERDSAGDAGGSAVGNGEQSSPRGESAVPVQRRLGLNEQNKKQKKTELTDKIFEEYQSQPLPIKGAKKHPANISESAAMSAIEPPPATYVPNIGQDIIDKGILSDVQLEAVTYAGQSHSQKLPDGTTRGFFLGDGTGVGKGRTISGIMLDNINRGDKKAVWLSLNDSLADDARRDIKALFGDDNIFTEFEGGKKADKILQKNSAILYVTYGKLSDSAEQGVTTNFDKIVKWLGKDFNGVIAFDEAHKMGNSNDQKGVRGTKKASRIGLAGVELQKVLPKAKIVYASATGATNIENLRYAERLGLWGDGTPFPDGKDFVTRIQAGGIAAMELVARDLKAMGVYVSRNISYDDVKYDRLTHKLTKDQKNIYDELARGWQIVYQNVGNALKATNQYKDGQKRQSVLSRFFSAQQRFFNQIITSMKMPSLISDIQKQLDGDNSVVVQLTNTNEAAQKRDSEKIKSEGRSLDELDITPSRILIEYVESGFPVHQYETYKDDKGNEQSRQVFDKDGNPVENREMVKAREELLEKLASIKVPDNPLDQIIDHFSVDMVAESTGRSKRFELKNGKRVEVPRGVNAKDADIQAFQDGKKRIIVFSDAGGTGKSYHADLTAKNQQHRVHYLLQAGWKADAAVQGFGRTHRSNQASAPTLVLAATDLKGENRFISTIAKRLDQLGALTKGQRQTGSQGLFSSSDNLEGSLAGNVLAIFYRDLLAGRIEGLNGKDILQKLGLLDKITDEFGNFKNAAAEVRKIELFLNRILALESDEQNAVFDAYSERLQGATEQAAQNGTLDTGLENYKAEKVELNEEQDIREDDLTGAKTKYYNLTAHHKIKPVKYGDINQNAGTFEGFYKNTLTGGIKAMFRTSSTTDQFGRVTDKYKLVGPAKTDYVTESKLSNLERVVKSDECESLWNEEVKTVPETQQNKLHLIGGAVLPVWDKLPTDNVRIYRVLTTNGDMLIGRVVADNMIDETLRRLGSARTKEAIATPDLINGIKKGDTVYLDNGWKITQRLVSSEHRIEIVGPDYRYTDSLKNKGVFVERIGTTTRYFILSGENAEKITDAILKISPVKNVENVSFSVDVDDETVLTKTRYTMDFAEFADAALAPMGIEVGTFFGDKEIHGYFDKENNRIYINGNSDKHPIATAGHELYHALDERARAQLVYFFRTQSKTNTPEFAAFKEKLMKKYQEVYSDSGLGEFTERDFWGEFAANNCETLFTNPELIETLAGKSKTLVQKILDFIRNLLKRLFGYSKYTNTTATNAAGLTTKQLAEAERMYAEVLKVKSWNISEAQANVAQTVPAAELAVEGVGYAPTEDKAAINLGQKQKAVTELPSGLLPQGGLSTAYVDPIIADILSDVKGFEERSFVLDEKTQQRNSIKLSSGNNAHAAISNGNSLTLSSIAQNLNIVNSSNEKIQDLHTVEAVNDSKKENVPVSTSPISPALDSSIPPPDNDVNSLDEKNNINFSFDIDDRGSVAQNAFAKQIDDWLQGKMKSNDYFQLGETPTVLKNLGANGLPVVMTQDVMRKITGLKHGIALDELKMLPKNIAEPIMIFESSTFPNSFVVLTEIMDKTGDDVVVAIHLNKTENRLNVNRVASVYGKPNIENFINMEINNGHLKYIDENKSLTWSTSRGIYSPKLVQSIFDSKDSLAQFGVIVKHKSENNINFSLDIDDVKLTPEREREIDAQFDKDRVGVIKPSKRQVWGERFEYVAHSVTRTFTDIPESGERGTFFAEFRKNMVQWKAMPKTSQFMAMDKINKMTAGLSKKEYRTFAELVYFRDLREEAKLQQERGYAEILLPNGIDPNEVNAVINKIESEEATPAVMDALEKRRKTWDSLKAQYISLNQEIGFDTEDRFTREDYYRHEVISHMNDKYKKGEGNRHIEINAGRGWLKQRKGSTEAINTDFLAVEYKTMVQMEYDIRIANTLKQTKEKYNIKPKLESQAFKANKQAMQDIIMAEAIKNGVNGEPATRLVSGRLELDSDTYRRQQSFNRHIMESFGKLIELAKDGKLSKYDESGMFSNAIAAFSRGELIDDVYRFAGELAKIDTTGTDDYVLTEAVIAARTALKYTSQKRAWVKGTLGKNYQTWESLAKNSDTHSIFQPRRGNYFYTKDVTDEDAFAKAFNEILDALVANPEIIQGAAADGVNIREVFAEYSDTIRLIGAAFEQWVIPNEIVTTMNKVANPIQAHGIEKAAKVLTNQWKGWNTTLNPIRTVKYGVRNLAGDLDVVIAGAPLILTHTPRAMKEVFEAMANKNYSKEFMEWAERGGYSSMLYVNDMDTATQEQLYKHLVGRNLTPLDILKAPIKGYTGGVEAVHNFREAILRYAGYLYFKDNISKNGGIVKDYRASRRSIMLGLDSVEDKAYQLSKDLLGAYDEISVMGQSLRNLAIPFYSFTESNFKRYMRLLINPLLYEGNIAQKAGKALARVVGTALLTALMTAWNKFVKNEDDEKLPSSVRERPHLTFGSIDDDVFAFTRLGSASEMLEWFGFDDFEWTKEDLYAPVDKLYGMFSPVKTPLEAVAGLTFYPSIAKPYPIRDWVEHLLNSIGLDSIYRYATGKPTGSLSDLALSAVVYKYDYKESAYNEIRGRKRVFEGKDANKDIYYPTAKSNALYYMRLAMKKGDNEKALKYLDDYFNAGGTPSGIATALDNMNPMDGYISKKTMAKGQEFAEWLDDNEREKLKIAQQFYDDTLSLPPGIKKLLNKNGVSNEMAKSLIANWIRATG